MLSDQRKTLKDQNHYNKNNWMPFEEIYIIKTKYFNMVLHEKDI